MPCRESRPKRVGGRKPGLESLETPGKSESLRIEYYNSTTNSTLILVPVNPDLRRSSGQYFGPLSWA